MMKTMAEYPYEPGEPVDYVTRHRLKVSINNNANLHLLSSCTARGRYRPLAGRRLSIEAETRGRGSCNALRKKNLSQCDRIMKSQSV